MHVIWNPCAHYQNNYSYMYISPCIKPCFKSTATSVLTNTFPCSRQYLLKLFRSLNQHRNCGPFILSSAHGITTNTNSFCLHKNMFLHHLQHLLLVLNHSFFSFEQKENIISPSIKRKKNKTRPSIYNKKE